MVERLWQFEYACGAYSPLLLKNNCNRASRTPVDHFLGRPKHRRENNTTGTPRLTSQGAAPGRRVRGRPPSPRGAAQRRRARSPPAGESTTTRRRCRIGRFGEPVVLDRTKMEGVKGRGSEGGMCEVVVETFWVETRKNPRSHPSAHKALFSCAHRKEAIIERGGRGVFLSKVLLQPTRTQPR